MFRYYHIFSIYFVHEVKKKIEKFSDIFTSLGIHSYQICNSSFKFNIILLKESFLNTLGRDFVAKTAIILRAVLKNNWVALSAANR